MKKHTLQEWCDFLGCAAVKNNFRVTNEPPGVFHRKQVEFFAHEPEIVPQNYGKPCYVDNANRGERGMSGGEIRLDINSVIGPEIWQLVADLDTVMTFNLVTPDDYGDTEPVKALSRESMEQMELADLLKPTMGDEKRGDCSPLMNYRNPEDKEYDK